MTLKEHLERFKIIDSCDWYTIYKDGEKIWENSSLHGLDIIKVLELPVNVLYPDNNWQDEYLEENGVLPDYFKEIKI